MPSMRIWRLPDAYFTIYIYVRITVYNSSGDHSCIIHIPFSVGIHAHPRVQGIQRCMGTMIYYKHIRMHTCMYRYTLYYVPYGECRQLLIIQTLAIRTFALHIACSRKIVSHSMYTMRSYVHMFNKTFSIKTSPPCRLLNHTIAFIMHTKVYTYTFGLRLPLQMCIGILYSCTLQECRGGLYACGGYGSQRKAIMVLCVYRGRQL